VSLTSGRWEVLLKVPQDIGDLGLHQPEDLAAAHFRRQLVEELGAAHAAKVGPEAERQFRRARAMHAGRPVLWAGFIMTTTPAGAGVEPDTSAWPEDPAQRAELAELAATPDALFISLTVGIRELTLPDGPGSPAAVLSRAIKARYRDDANVHLVRYGDVHGVAVVRVQTFDPKQVERAGLPSGAATVEHYLAEVNLIFPDDDALVTVTAATPNGGALNDAVLLAGTLARGVRVRAADPQVRAAQEAARAAANGAAAAGSQQRDDGAASADGAAPVTGGSPHDHAPTPDAAAQRRDDGAASVAAPLSPADLPRDGAATAAAQPAPAAPLAVVLPDGQLLPEGFTLLGRGPRRTAELPADHTVTLPDDSISRTHLALRVAAGAVSATDLHSTNGTLLRRPDGQISPLVPGEETELTAGDEVNLGAALLRVVRQP